MVQIERWQKAQEAEISHHQGIGSFNISNFFAKFDSSYENILSNKNILEVGCGTGGITYSLRNKLNESSRIIGVDPILLKLNNPNITKYPVISAAGEKLPFVKNTFDIVISINVLDHVLSPTDVLDEIYRVLQSDGTLFIKINTFSRRKSIRRLFDKIDKEHPHHFSSSEVLDLLNESAFTIQYEHHSNRNIIDRSLTNWSIKWIMGHLVGGFDTFYVEASPEK